MLCGGCVCLLFCSFGTHRPRTVSFGEPERCVGVCRRWDCVVVLRSGAVPLKSSRNVLCSGSFQASVNTAQASKGDNLTVSWTKRDAPRIVDAGRTGKTLYFFVRPVQTLNTNLSHLEFLRMSSNAQLALRNSAMRSSPFAHATINATAQS